MVTEAAIADWLMLTLVQNDAGVQVRVHGLLGKAVWMNLGRYENYAGRQR
jgi:hypothetical protein